MGSSELHSQAFALELHAELALGHVAVHTELFAVPSMAMSAHVATSAAQAAIPFAHAETSVQSLQSSATSAAETSAQAEAFQTSAAEPAVAVTLDKKPGPHEVEAEVELH